MSRRALLGALLVLACRRESADGEPALPSSGPSAAAASAAPQVPARPWYAGAWSGSYEAALNKPEPAPGALRDWAKDDGSTAAGKGTLNLTVDDQGAVSGTADGPLGAQRVSGTVDGEALRLALSPQAAELKAFRGTVVAQRDGDVLRGTLRAGSGDGANLRQGPLELRRASTSP